MPTTDSKTLVIRNGTLIDGSGAPAAANTAVVIEGNRITSVGELPGGINLEDTAQVEEFRAIDFQKLLELDMDDRTWGWTLQMQIRAVRHSFRILEMEVDHGPRAGGESKISGSALGTVRAGSRMLFTLLTERLRPGP